MRHQRLFVFDIETVPDTGAVKALTGFESDDVGELRAELERYHLEITDGRNAFPRQPFHKIVAISFLEAEIVRDGGEEYYQFKRLESGQVEDEGEMVKRFFQYFDTTAPRLVSYNGRGFDLPVLRFRAMAHGVQSHVLHDKTNKWDNYSSRYSADWHCDLLDVLKDYGAVAGGLKLDEVCSILGFPGKFGVDGSKVSQMFDDGDLPAIRHYCETDVLNTYLVYLRHMHHIGATSTSSYNQAIEDVLAFIDEAKDQRPYLDEFRAAWEEACGGDYLLGE